MRGMDFDWGTRTFLMGIVNVSPDSFAGDGLQTVDAAVAQGVRMVQEGADVLDVGGESTQAGFLPDTPGRRDVPRHPGDTRLARRCQRAAQRGYLQV